MRHRAFTARECQQLFLLAEAPVVDAADLSGFAERPLPAAADEGAKSTATMAISPSRSGRSSSLTG
jgi:hypothetical protein